ncbi:MAG: hypothetical protein JOZ69_17680, partial [Myxococcales bacterium]|nr:hypothetical protein [Myxococcales bacterium]
MAHALAMVVRLMETPRRRSRSLAAAISSILCAAGALVACHGAARPPPRTAPSPELVVAPLPAASVPKLSSGDDRRTLPRSHLISRIGRAALGPFLARTRKEGIAVWVVASERGERADVVAVPLAADGAPLAPPGVVATAPRETTSLVIRPSRKDGQGSGWLVAWAGLVDRGESLTTLTLGTDGSVRTGPTELQRTNDHVAWVDLVPTAQGAIALWAEETVAGTANLLSDALDPTGRPRSVPMRVARELAGWAAAPAAAGAALALVTREPGKGRAAAGNLA